MNISRIILGVLLIVGAGGALAGGTGAFFSDTESSIGNFFTAGEIDLLVDNDSYYNGNHCVDGLWVGDADFPKAGEPCDTSWLEDNLNDGLTTIHKFFNFNDVKPSDEGEDTISLHVQNDAWMCMDVTLTSNDDNTCVTDTENPDDPTCAEPDADEWDGELAQQINMIWWADDGDNVLEDGEPILSDGVETLFDLATTSPFSVALADSQNNAWNEVGPVPADDIHYIAKAWCFGTLLPAPLAQGEGGPQERGGGYSCDGDGINNAAQTDQATLDVAFRAMQARNNDNFLCTPPTTGTITVRKAIEPGNDPTPPLDQTAFAPYMVDGSPIAYGVATPFAPGPHTVTETNTDPDYTATFSLDCAPGGVVNVVAGDDHECIITNTYAPQCVLTGANILPNGGFESPEVTFASPNQWDIFPSVAGGWTIDWRSDIPASFGGSTRPAPAHLELHEGVLGAAFEGDQYAELDSDWNGHVGTLNNEPASISVYQDIPTEVGATYEVTFNWAARPSTAASNNRLRTEWDGVIVHDTGTLADANAGITWVSVGPIAVTATGATTRIRFTDMGVANSLGTFLDNVRVVKTSCGPGPANVPVASPEPTGATSIFSNGFGTGPTDTSVTEDGWSEGSQGAEKRAIGSGNDTASPDGGRFAVIFSANGGGNNGWICRTVDATARHTNTLSYYWRGDGDANDSGDDGVVEYKIGGACSDGNDGTGWTQLQNHDLQDDAAWTTQSAFALPGNTNGATFLLRFRSHNAENAEYFRVDGVNISGIAI